MLQVAKRWVKGKAERSPSIFNHPLAGYFIKAYYRKLWEKRGLVVKVDTLTVENTSICNGSCEICPYKRLKRPKTTMRHEDFCRLIDIAGKESIKKVHFANVGEPLIDPEIIRKVDYISRKGMQLSSITTNGSLLNEGLAHELLRYPWERFIFSIDGATKETYEAVRGLSYEQVMENVRRFLELRKKLKSPVKGVRLNMVVYEKNRHEEADFFAAWREHLIPGRDDIASLYAVNFGGQVGINYSAGERERRIRIPCGRLWDSAVMLSVSGDVILCCGDYEVDNQIGNVFQEEGIDKLWNNQRMQGFRRLHINGDFDAMPACRQCNENYFLKPYFKVRGV